jgi:hypothetical protein
MRHQSLVVTGTLLMCITQLVGCSSGDSKHSGANGTPNTGGSGNAAGSPLTNSGAPNAGGTANSAGSPAGIGGNSGGLSSAAGAAATGATASGGQSAGSTGTGATANFANPNGHCAIPAAGQPEDTSTPDHVIGHGTADTCNAADLIAAVAQGGVITFDCGPSPATITMTDTAKVFNVVNGVNNQKVVIDGGGKVTLDGGGVRRILWQNTCDSALVYATTRCDIQSFPQLTVQNIAFSNGLGFACETSDPTCIFGGGAIYVQGGTFKAYNIEVVSSAQTNNNDPVVQDLAGGAIYTTMLTAPAYIVNSTFQGNSGINGGALGSIGTSYTIINSVFSGNSATGHGENPARSGTTGGGLGGAIYNDGTSYTLDICGTDFENNTANELGTGSIFMVANPDSNNVRNGTLNIDQSTFVNNSNTGSVQSNPSIFVEAKDDVGVAGVNITNTTFQ